MRILLSLLISVLILNATPVMAQEAQEVQVNKENVSDLIGTLENEKQRNEFINNLKTLTKADEEINKPEVLPEISHALGLDSSASEILNSYEEFLAKHNLNGSTLGKIGVTIISLLIAMVILYLVRRLGVLLRNRVINFKNKIGLKHGRLRIYARVFRYFGYFITIMLLVYTLNIIWGVVDLDFLESERFGAFFGDLTSILLLILVSMAVWEAINAVLDNILNKADISQSARLQTILPLVRNVIFIVFLILFTLVFLSELGIDIVPLLAGAGIFGIAIGFGAQTMVKDFLTGFTIILEDLIQVGDVAKLGDKTGLIEKITLRKVQLRDLSGIVYTVPFSDVGIIENWTKDFSYYVMDIGVAYREDTDQVTALLKEVDEELRHNLDFEDLILEPLEVLGVDAFADSAVIIKARIKTKPIQQWNVGREFNRRMKYKFDEHGIEIPFPHQTVYFGEDKDGKAPSLPVRIEETAKKAQAAKKTKKKS